MRLLFVFLSFVFLNTGYAQNYLGYGKAYIIKAIKHEREDLIGPVIVKNEQFNYISYVSKDKKRAVFYHFEKKEVVFENGKKSKEEICVKYVSRNGCRSYSECPEMDDVVRSLNSKFTGTSALVWMDYSKKIPHEWVLVHDENFFEVHVTEKKPE